MSDEYNPVSQLNTAASNHFEMLNHFLIWHIPEKVDNKTQ